MLRATGAQGVNWYTEGIARFAVYFPEGNTDCRHCPFCRYNEAFHTYRCLLTEEYIEKYDLDKRNRLCPIEFEETPF